MKKICILALGVLFSVNVFATTEFSKTLTRIGNQAGNLAYIYVTPVPARNCKFGVLYLGTNSTFGKTSYATLLAAKIENRKISRVDYVKYGDQRCFITLLEMK